VEAAPVCATKRLAAFVHACGADGAKKLHGEGVRLAPFAGTEEFERHPDWQNHQRLEVNTRLDGASRDLVFTARADTGVVKLQKALLTRTLLNKRGARAAVEKAYRADVGRSLYDGAVDEAAFAQALRGVQLDNAKRRPKRRLFPTKVPGQELQDLSTPVVPTLSAQKDRQKSRRRRQKAKTSRPSFQRRRRRRRSRVLKLAVLKRSPADKG